ncbi:unnamed protein product [Durusdinium trenchii]|uniref:Uncharacterized protein n=1 Tax=Durusdinium trenchii TaxID=1381693 RepID=A0ABP0MK49_9DINO
MDEPEPMDLSEPESEPKDTITRRKQLLMVETVREMKLTSMEIQRVTPCYHVLTGLGRVLRRNEARSYYHLSEPKAKIPQFVSHSWHGGSWKKIAMLLVMKNGPAAVLTGSFFAFVMVTLSSLGMLPGYERRPVTEMDRTYVFAPWGSCTGMLVATVVLILGRPRGLVFLDKICIHQTDKSLTLQGIINIGAFLKNSQSMLVLWDVTYVERLWCMFELAAFLKSCEGGRVKLDIKPTILGPMTILCFVCMFVLLLVQIPSTWDNRLHGLFIWGGINCITMLGAVHFWRTFYRQFDSMKTQLQHFSIDHTTASCCQVGHVDQKGRRIPCDKETLVECIKHWFGSVEEFEQTVRTNVAATLTAGIGNLAFPYKYLLAAGTPTLWGQADFVASRLREGEFYHAGATAIFGLAHWFGAIPFIFAVGGASQLWSPPEIPSMR